MGGEIWTNALKVNNLNNIFSGKGNKLSMLNLIKIGWLMERLLGNIKV